MNKGISKIVAYTAKCRHCGLESTSFSSTVNYINEIDAIKWQKDHEESCVYNPKGTPSCSKCIYAKSPIGEYSIDCEKKNIKSRGCYCDDYVYRPIKKEKVEKKKDSRNGK